MLLDFWWRSASGAVARNRKNVRSSPGAFHGGPRSVEFLKRLLEFFLHFGRRSVSDSRDPPSKGGCYFSSRASRCRYGRDRTARRRPDQIMRESFAYLMLRA